MLVLRIIIKIIIAIKTTDMLVGSCWTLPSSTFPHVPSDDTIEQLEIMQKPSEKKNNNLAAVSTLQITTLDMFACANYLEQGVTFKNRRSKTNIPNKYLEIKLANEGEACPLQSLIVLSDCSQLCASGRTIAKSPIPDSVK